MSERPIRPAEGAMGLRRMIGLPAAGDVRPEPVRKNRAEAGALRAAEGTLRRAAAWALGRTGRKADRSFRLRLLVQSGFALLCVLLGVQFARFYLAARAGDLPLPHRPPGVEAFLPISGLMGLLDWLYQGTLNPVHPAATVLLLIALALALLLRKSFCSWVCPIGFLSELLARLGRRLLGRNFRPWRWIDLPLQGLKYLLLGFFVWAIATMDATALRAFIESPYNRVADVKMGLFFVNLTVVGGSVLALLAGLSVLVQGAWCRYLCPYGALLGLFSRLSPVRVHRAADPCIDCGLCDRVCMSRLPVSRVGSIGSVECTGCLDCLAVCPVKEALTVRAAGRRLSVPTYAAAVLALFLLAYVGARWAGTWENSIGDLEYVARIRSIEQREYAHPGSDGGVPEPAGGAATRPAAAR